MKTKIINSELNGPHEPSSLVPRPTPRFSMLHAEKREGLVDLVM